MKYFNPLFLILIAVVLICFMACSEQENDNLSAFETPIGEVGRNNAPAVVVPIQNVGEHGHFYGEHLPEGEGDKWYWTIGHGFDIWTYFYHDHEGTHVHESSFQNHELRHVTYNIGDGSSLLDTLLRDFTEWHNSLGHTPRYLVEGNDDQQ